MCFCKLNDWLIDWLFHACAFTSRLLQRRSHGASCQFLAQLHSAAWSHVAIWLLLGRRHTVKSATATHGESEGWVWDWEASGARDKASVGVWWTRSPICWSIYCTSFASDAVSWTNYLKSQRKTSSLTVKNPLVVVSFKSQFFFTARKVLCITQPSVGGRINTCQRMETPVT